MNYRKKVIISFSIVTISLALFFTLLFILCSDNSPAIPDIKIDTAVKTQMAQNKQSIKHILSGHKWNMTTAIPALDTPTTITLPGKYLTTTTHELCSGPAYLLNLNNEEDYVITSTSILTAPVRITGGRNVRIVGLEIRLDDAPCKNRGSSGYIPGTIALRTSQVGASIIEGVYIDVAGRSADCIVVRNIIGNYNALEKGFNEEEARGARDVFVLNSVCRGNSGDVNVHGDILQTQGEGEIFRKISLENVTADSNCQGTTLEPQKGYALANEIVVRRFDYRMDNRYVPNPIGSSAPVGHPNYDGGALMHSAKQYVYDQVYLSRNEAPYEMIQEEQGKLKSVRPACNNSSIFCGMTPSLNRFASPGTEAASNLWTGINYVSPFPF